MEKRHIILDEPLKPYFDELVKAHCKAQKQLGIPATVYVLIGSRSHESTFHVFHASKCPLPDTATEEEVQYVLFFSSLFCV